MRFLRRVRVRPVQQMEAAECGVACLTMVLSYHGHAAPLADVRQACGTSRDGNSALDLLKGARQRGLQGRGVKVSLAGLALLRRPAILHWDLNHFVVLEAIGKRGARIVDPASGRRSVTREELDRQFSGIALELRPGVGFVRLRPSSLSLSRYRTALVRAWKTLAFVVLANVTGQLLALTFPAASQILIDHVISPRRSDWLLPVLAVIALGALSQIVLVVLQGSSQALLSSTLGWGLTTELGSHLLRLPLPFLDSRSHGDLLGRVHVQSALQAILSRIAQSGFDLVLVVLLGGLMLAYDLRLGTLAFALMALRIVVMRILRAPAENRFAAELAAGGRVQAVLVEATTSPELIKGLGVEARMVERYRQRTTERAVYGISSAKLQAGVGISLQVLGGLMEAIVLWYGGGRVMEGEMTVGEFAGFLALRSLVAAPLDGLVNLFESWVQLRGAFERSDDVLSVPVAPPGTVVGSPVFGRIELRGVGFRYGSGGPWVLRKVDLVINPGERVTLIGPSGHGKSTLGRLIAGLLEPTEGEVLLDGVPIAQYEPSSLAAEFGVVLQDPLIWAGTVKESLSLRVPDASLAALEQAARRACFAEVVQRLNGGYDAHLLSGGTNLSGGERQRLALAQALVGTPRVLLLDEATSALDPDTERRVLDQLDALPATIVSIAHKESVIRRAQRVVAVTDGAVAELQPVRATVMTTTHHPVGQPYVGGGAELVSGSAG